MNFKDDFKQRVAGNKPTRWVRFGIVSIIFFLWVAWMGSWWLALLWFLLFDIYITGYIPLTWWKKSDNKAVRSVMSWVDAIVYALVLVYFIFAFVGQNYQIPSSSLEKTLLTGDYLWVNKMVYGPRVPMTPVAFPLVHNKMFGVDSYLDNPSLSYKRLKGLRNVEHGDIVVFNFPAGDTVLTAMEESPEYYYSLLRSVSKEHILANPDKFGEIKYRPVDRRQNFVKRAVGLPGERIRISGDTLYLDGVAQPFPENVQFKYILATTHVLDSDLELLHDLGITPDDVMRLAFSPTERQYLSMVFPQAATSPFLYMLPLTSSMITSLSDMGYVDGLVKSGEVFPLNGEQLFLFPSPLADTWTLSDYGGDEGLLIPAKGMTIPLNATTWTIYNRCIRNYEGHTDSWLADDGTVYVDGKKADSYTFAMDYYFMMGDNRDLSQDSRFWGFVPEDHIVGTPMFVLVSIDKDRSLLNGGIRFNRIFRDANPDK